MGSAGRSPTDRSYLSIREVLDLLLEEFPDVTISKIRFLESRGLISPERTPSGYRKFYDLDVERLRWILRQQREHFLPLKVIKGRLDNGNGHEVDEPQEPSLFDAYPVEPPAVDVSPVVAAAVEPAAVLAASANNRNHPVHATNGEATAAPARVPALSDLAIGTRPAIFANGNGLPRAEMPPSSPPSEPVLAPAAPTSRDGMAPAPPASARAAADTESTSSAAVVEAEVPSDPPPPAVSPPVRSRSRRNNASMGTELSAEELAAAAGTDVALVGALVEFGLLEPRILAGVQSFAEEAVPLVKAAAGFSRFGIEARHLRTFKHAAERETGLFSQIVTPLLLQRNPAARARALEQLEELTALGAAMQAALVQHALRDLTGR